MWTHGRLLLFTRYPEAGTTKTRLIAKLGAEGAASLQKRLTERVVARARLLQQRRRIATTIHYTGGNSEKMSIWLGPMHFIAQKDGDLGQRMQAAFMHAFAGGVERAVLVGSDIPDISVHLLEQAFTALLDKEVVIGPSEDGGYYLIGLTAKQAAQLFPLLFTAMPWSTKELFTTTRERLDQAGYAAAILPTLRDIDLPDDLPFARERGLL